MPTLDAQKLPILLVSESPTDRAQAERVFRDRLNAVGDPEAALDAVQRQTFAAILLDDALRGGGAGRLVHALRAVGDTTPVVVLTDSSDETAAASALRDGAAGCVAKRAGLERALEVLVGCAARAAGAPPVVEAPPPAPGRGTETETVELLLFEVAGQRHALLAADVQAVLPAVTVSPLPGAPAGIAGVINVRGTLVPVLDVRLRLGLPAKPVEHTDHLITLAVAGRPLALHVDRALDIVRTSRRQAGDEEARGGHAGVARVADGLVFIHDPAAFLSAAEAAGVWAACRPA